MLLRKCFFFFSFLVIFSGFSVAQQLSSEKLRTNTPDSASFSTKQISITDSIINYGKYFLNSPYRHGGKGDSSSFDCSGFTSFVYRNFGFKLGASSADQAEQFDTVDRCNLKKGDLVFFAGRRPGKRVGHVGIVVDADQDGRFNFIHASTQHGVIISNSDEPYYLRRYIKAGRVIFNNQQIPIAPANSSSELFSSQQQSENALSPVFTATTQTKKFIPARYHRVKKGENLADIADKYGLTLAELKKKNKIKGSKIKPNQRLKIKDAETVMLVNTIQPSDNRITQLSDNKVQSDTTTKSTQNISNAAISDLHTVLRGETLFSISRLYNIPLEELKEINHILNGVVRVGQKLKVISGDNPIPKPKITSLSETGKKSEIEVKQNTESTQPKTHVVTVNETLFSIAKLYNVTVEELKRFNHLTSNKIKGGQQLKLTENSNLEDLNLKSAQSTSKNDNSNPKKKITYKVKHGDTYFSIAHKYDCKVTDLKNWNKKSGNKVKVGEKLVIFQ